MREDACVLLGTALVEVEMNRAIPVYIHGNVNCMGPIIPMVEEAIRLHVHKTKCFFVIALLIFSCPWSCKCAQLNEVQASESAKNAIRIEEGSASIYARTVRCENYEDDLFECQLKIPGEYAKYAYFYQGFDYGIEIVSPERYITHIGSDLPKWCVAVSRQKGKTYGLYGFKMAVENFNQLARDATLGIEKETTAQAYLRLFYQCVIRNNYGIHINSNSDLKCKLPSYLCSGENDRECQEKYDKWWSGFDLIGKMIDYNKRLEKKDDKYFASFVTLLPTSDVPICRFQSFSFTAQGLVAPITLRYQYPETTAHKK